MESSTPFRGSSDVYEWIYTFVNIERGQNLSHRSFRLDRMKILADLAGRPETCAPAIHVAGSKGKGSVTGMISAILGAAGKKCSLYASPHVTDFRERITLGGFFFDENIYSAAGNELRNIVNFIQKSKDPQYDLFNNEKEEGEEPTYFELMTMWFFLCSRAAKVDVMAIETGMGGRLDATNIIDPLVSVITLIELEHTEYLGNTIAAIAGEKAGIIKNNRPVIAAQQKDEALEVFRRKAKETASDFYYFPEWGEVRNVGLHRNGTTFDLTIRNPKNRENKIIYDEMKLHMYGKNQAENAGLAILAVKKVFQEIDGEIAVKGLAGFSLPARFERLPAEQDFIIDGAHTPTSVQTTVSAFTQLYGNGGILIFGCAAGKDVNAMAALVIPFFSRIIITTPGTFKKSFPQEVYEVFIKQTAETVKHGMTAHTSAVSSGTAAQPDAESHVKTPEILFLPDTAEAVNLAMKFARELKLPVLGTGSFYLSAEIKGMIR